MLTKKDRQQLILDFKEIFATKDDLKDLKDVFVTKIEHQKSHNELIVKLDKIAGSMDTYQTEQTLSANSQLENTETLENHETRLKALEKRSGILPT